MRRNGDVSFWYASAEMPTPAPPLPGDRSADVCIVGAGFTGLWTAYYLKRAAPDLDIVVLEREFAGFGASGRNGGWLSSNFAGSRRRIEREHGRQAVVAMEHAMRESVDEVIAVCASEGIDADVLKHGVLHVARNAAQVARLRQAVAEDSALGLYAAALVELDAVALESRIRVADAKSALWNPDAARVHPAKLVQGLAADVRRLGVRIYESTTVHEIRPGMARSNRGTVSAEFVLSCLEGFTASLRGQRRAWLPLNSAMIVTTPLPTQTWGAIGWEGCELLGDGAHAYMYAQRTADGRIALGGRGVPYRFGSRTDTLGRTQQRTIEQLVSLFDEMFPAAAGIPIEHAWCGVLGVPRDWSPTVRLDRSSGLGVAGGYVGSGVATTNLAGRTLRDLVLGHDTELTRLPWVGHTSRRWEPEPARWLGSRLVYGLYRAADRREAASASPRTHSYARIAAAIAGR